MENIEETELINEKLSDNLDELASEITGFQNLAGMSVFEIGRRLKHVHDDLIEQEHGAWTAFLKRVSIGKPDAKKYMKVFETFGKVGTSQPLSKLGVTSLYMLSNLSDEERDTEFETATGETKKPEDMTVKELRELRRQLEMAKIENQTLSDQVVDANETAKSYQKQAEEARQHQQVKEVKVEVTPDDYEDLKAENSRLQATISDKEAVIAKDSEDYNHMQATLNELKQDSAEAESLKAKMKELATKKDKLSKDIITFTDLAKLANEITAQIDSTSLLLNRLNLSGVDVDKALQFYMHHLINAQETQTNHLKALMGDIPDDERTVVDAEMVDMEEE